MIIEIVENIIQIVVLLACVGVALFHAGKYRSRTWTLLALFYGSWAMDDLFWLLCLVFTGDSPVLGAAADLNWYASLVFLYLLIAQISPPESKKEKRVLPWITQIFAFAMAAFYIVKAGNVISNLIYAGLMGLAMFAATRRLLDGEHRNHRFFLIMVLFFCLLEYALWTISCFDWPENLANPYYWCDLMITVALALLIPAVKKAVAE